MTEVPQKRIGFTCAYTPLPLIDAANFVPWRILPLTAAADQAGALLHDNMCPHVKRVLDRALAGDLPELTGVVFMNSCDAMRRLADAWQVARPREPAVVIDLPVSSGEAGVAYFAGELARLADRLVEWGGQRVTAGSLARSAGRYSELARGLARLDARVAGGRLAGGRRAMQGLLNDTVTMPLEHSLAELARLEAAAESTAVVAAAVPLYLFGNVLPDPEAFELFESCGGRLVADDLCTGSRQIVPLELDRGGEPLRQLARGLLSRPACARTLEAPHPGKFAARVVAGAKDCGARGVIAHVMKFCDPYLVRLPAVRAALREVDLPLLVLEGDCTLRSLGQHRTRIEAFVEMLGGNRS